MKFLFISLFITIFLLTGCFKTAEQVEREKKFDAMSQQLSASQNIVADLTQVLKNLQSQIDQLNGKIEVLENEHKNTTNQLVHKHDEDQKVIESKFKVIEESIEAYKNEIKEHKNYLEKVNGELEKINTPVNAKEMAKTSVSQAKKLISQKKYKEAKNILEGLVENKSLDASDRNKIFHSLGLIGFNQKKWDKAVVFFSKIYTKYPKSSLAANSLYLIAKCLDELGKKEEAKAAYAQLKEQYPESNEAKKIK